MLRHRLVTGTLLAAGIVGILIVDDSFSPYYPVLLILAVGVGVLASRELLAIIPTAYRPEPKFTMLAVAVLLTANWWPTAAAELLGRPGYHPWATIQATFICLVLIAFLVEMKQYTGSTGPLGRLAGLVFVLTYLGLLASCFIQLRWLTGYSSTSWLLFVTIFVPKCCDIGAYTTGRIFGRTPFTPRLSPKKTWEGIVGGILFAVAAAVAIDSYAGLFRHGMVEAVAFGLVVGWAGIFGDLAESMIKREGGVKDASQSLPGFGGLLDVLDSILWSAPIAWLWFSR